MFCCCLTCRHPGELTVKQVLEIVSVMCNMSKIMKLKLGFPAAN